MRLTLHAPSVAVPQRDGLRSARPRWLCPARDEGTGGRPSSPGRFFVGLQRVPLCCLPLPFFVDRVADRVVALSHYQVMFASARRARARVPYRCIQRQRNDFHFSPAATGTGAGETLFGHPADSRTDSATAHARFRWPYSASVGWACGFVLLLVVGVSGPVRAFFVLSEVEICERMCVRIQSCIP